MRKSLPVMNPPSGPISSAPTVPTSSGVPARPAEDTSIMRRYPAPRGPVSSSLASGVMMIPGLIVLTLAPRLPQRTASAMVPHFFPLDEVAPDRQLGREHAESARSCARLPVQLEADCLLLC